MDEFLEKLAKRLKFPGDEILSADEIAAWPEGKLNELLSQGILSEIQHASGVVCDECEEGCYIEPDLRKYPTGETVGVFTCTRNPDISRIEVDLNRLRQWQVNKRILWKLAFGFDSEWRVPWDDSNNEYITLQDAVNLANHDAITVRKMSRLLEDPEFPVHHMHKGRRGKVHLGEFRRGLKYAKHGTITDEAIEKYLEQTEMRKKEARAKKRSKGKPDSGQ
ncbi:MAG: hypothetical protein JW720_00750 [Sedimentisphaerales bacterium]|nr:hypothetical protein [Sedimentisphaerales bacterium]